MNNDNTHICWPPVFLSPTSLHHATKKQRQQAQINRAKILVVLCFPQIRERFQPKLCESNTIQYLRRSIATDMNNLRPTGKVIRQRKGRISLCCLFNACNRKFEANFGNVGLSGRAWGSWVGGGGGVVLACFRAAMKYAYGFCIRWMSVLCMISSLLSVATSCYSDNHNRCPWLTKLYIASVSSSQASHSCKARHFIFPTPSSWNNLPNLILLPFTLKFETSVKLKQCLLLKILKDSGICSNMAMTSSYD